MNKSIDGKKILNDIHEKVDARHKEVNAPRNLVIKTVAITLVSVVALSTMFWLGGVYNQGLTDRISIEAKALNTK